MTIYGSHSPEAAHPDLPTYDPSPSEIAQTPFLVGESPAMQRLRLQIERIGPHFRMVLVRGEIGTGKELVARALHARSERAEKPFTVCPGARLAETEQKSTHDGFLFSSAIQDGTVFLDGTDEMSTRAQKNLLAALDQKTGLRIIAATSQDLRVMSKAGLFRQDLCHRLATVEIVLEPLRDRTDDIPELANYFLGRFAQRYGKPVDAIAPDAMEKLLQHEWPGNVRELENVVHNGVLQCEEKLLRAHDLQWMMQDDEVAEGWKSRCGSGEPLRLQQVIDRHVLRVLQECSGNKVRAADILGISRSTLYRMLEACSEESDEQEP